MKQSNIEHQMALLRLNSNYTVVQLAVRNEFFPRFVHFQKFSTANHNQDSFSPKVLDLVKKILCFEKNFSYVLDVDKNQFLKNVSLQLRFTQRVCHLYI